MVWRGCSDGVEVCSDGVEGCSDGVEGCSDGVEDVVMCGGCGDGIEGGRRGLLGVSVWLHQWCLNIVNSW